MRAIHRTRKAVHLLAFAAALCCLGAGPAGAAQPVTSAELPVRPGPSAGSPAVLTPITAGMLLCGIAAIRRRGLPGGS
ncbi:hypothetical protein ACIQGZ_18765 [Streptomyces sp. NPDC092296]|uniref:hypothetical protein n=1 Tax=Streptomyces sp. NPDC092296 TaxID=3366012 RepID=UPI0038112F5A